MLAVWAQFNSLCYDNNHILLRYMNNMICLVIFNQEMKLSEAKRYCHYSLVTPVTGSVMHLYHFHSHSVIICSTWMVLHLIRGHTGSCVGNHIMDVQFTVIWSGWVHSEPKYNNSPEFRYTMFAVRSTVKCNNVSYRLSAHFIEDNHPVDEETVSDCATEIKSRQDL